MPPSIVELLPSGSVLPMPRLLTVHRSPRGEDLALRLAEVLSQPTGDPLAADAVVVHSKGLERWLAMQLAAANGICANVDFCFPQELLGAAFSAALGPEADASQWSQARIAWAILASLPELDDVPELGPVRDFIAAGEGLDNDRRRIDVAMQIAGLFERYSAYRPDMVRAWSDGGGEGWEPPLWRAASTRIPGHDLAGLATGLVAALEASDRTLSDALPRRICVFSVSTLPPLTVRLFALLAKHLEIHLFLLAPSDSWWAGLAEVASRLPGETMPSPAAVPELPTHPLLESMGTLARDFQLSVLRSDHTEADAPPRATSQEAVTTLARLQEDLGLGALPAAQHPIDEADRSIQIHSCHGPMRQVQVLRDVLVTAFDEIPDLEPRDVLVMAPEIEQYAAIVRAVFGDGSDSWRRRAQHPGGIPKMPFRLADRGAAAANPAAEALLSVLRLAGGRLKANEVLDLLAREPVRRRFGLSSEDLPRVRQWAVESGIRWAAGSEHRAALDQPAVELYTWRHGLDRLLAGQAVADPEGWVLGVRPHGEVQGRDDRATLGGFVDFAETVLRWTDELTAARSVTHWRDALLRVLEDFVALDHGSGWQLDQVRAGLAEVAAEASEAGFEGTLDRGAIESLLQGRFSIAEPGGGFLSGGVTFCQLVPMRSIPFRVICLLGMDDGAFPRLGGSVAFDRMEQAPRVGDRSVREDDRGLFLEAVLSARDRLVVTYSGRSVRSDRPRPAAVPVAELMDVVDRSFVRGDGGRPSDGLVTQHPLQPFSPRNFSPRGADARPFGIDERQRSAAEAWRRGRGATAAAGDEPFLTAPLSIAPPAPASSELPELELDRVAGFFKDPMESFCRARLGLWPSDEATDAEDREPLKAPSSLVAWSLRDELVAEALGGADLTRPGPASRSLRQRPGLPLGMPGDVAYDELAEEARGIAAQVLAVRAGAPKPPVEVDLDVGGTRLLGWLDGLCGSGRVEHRAGTVRAEHLLQAWVRHLALQIAGGPSATWLVGRNGGAGFAEMEAVEAHSILDGLVRLHLLGLQTPLLLFPDASRSWVERDRWTPAPDEDPPALRWPPKEYGPTWRSRFLGDADPFAATFADPALAPTSDLSAPALAERVWGPVLDRLQELPS